MDVICRALRIDAVHRPTPSDGAQSPRRESEDLNQHPEINEFMYPWGNVNAPEGTNPIIVLHHLSNEDILLPQ